MKRFLSVVVLAAVALAVVLPAPASAIIRGVSFANHTSHCVWMTIYHDDMGWEIYGDAARRPRHIRSGVTFVIDSTYTQNVKVRAQVERNADCSGGTIDDTYTTFNSSPSAHSVKPVAYLRGQPGAFTWSWNH